FQGQTDEDSLNMTYRYGYEVIDEKPTLHHHIILEAKEGQVIVAPMDGKVSLDGENVILTSGKGVNKTKLTLFGIHSGRVSENQQVLAGDIIGQTKDGTGLKVTYQKVDDDTDKLVYVNPAFYFPKVIQVQTTILPTIGQFGGDEFERAKAIYDYLKSKGATNQAIAAILGNWSVE
ncbi:phage tail tip lysozyme, partial [Streptococcus suis]